jgi:hypothetical protein
MWLDRFNILTAAQLHAVHTWRELAQSICSFLFFVCQIQFMRDSKMLLLLVEAVPMS